MIILNSQLYQRAKQDISNNVSGILLMFAIPFFTNLITGFIPFIGSILGLLLSLAEIPLIFVLFDSIYVRHEVFDVGTIFNRLVNLWKMKINQMVKPIVEFLIKTVVYSLGVVVIGAVLIATLTMLLEDLGGAFCIAFLVIILGVPLFLSVTYLLQIRLNHDLISIYYDVYNVPYNKEDAHEIIMKLVLWCFVPVAGWIMSGIKMYIYTLKMMYEIREIGQPRW